MAKVIGQDIPSKYYDAYSNFLSRSYSQPHQNVGGSVKLNSSKFPWWYKYYKFPSPAQLYVRAVFLSATQCWHLQPDVGGEEKPLTGPRSKEWWSMEARKDRTFGYRKFMSDTLLQKFRVGEPTWCVPSSIPFCWINFSLPDTSYCDGWNMFVRWWTGEDFRFTFLRRPPEDVGKEFLYLHAWYSEVDPEQTTFVVAFAPEWFGTDLCLMNYNNQPRDLYFIDRLINVGPAWYRFFVGDLNFIGIGIYFDRVWWPQISPRGRLVFASPLHGDVGLRPFFSLD